MKVLLMDLDIVTRRRPFPNLALMKLSAYHKAKGDEVFLNFPLMSKPDITYASCVFTWNAQRKATIPLAAEQLYEKIILPGQLFVGGSGIDLKAELEPAVEYQMPDYSLYPGVDFSLGFTSRGCPRRCPWCVVPQKEGTIREVASIYQFWDRRHRRIVLLDNNILAASHWRTIMEELIAERLEVDFNSGLDIRLVNEENVDYLKRIRTTRELRFAFDDISYEKGLRRGIELLLASGINSRKLLFYFLYGFPEINEECLERVKILASYNVSVYPMAYRGPDGKEPQRRILKGIEGIPLLHGDRRPIKRFLRFVGRLPE
jgi:hypothetical protein